MSGIPNLVDVFFKKTKMFNFQKSAFSCTQSWLGRFRTKEKLVNELGVSY